MLEDLQLHEQLNWHTINFYNQTLRIANLPTNYDPDDLIKQRGKDALKDIIKIR